MARSTDLSKWWRDITQSKQVEVAFQESEQRFRLMAETIQDVFWIATPHIGRTMYVSPGFEYIWGRTSEALYHNPKLFLETVHPEDRERVKSEIIAARMQSTPWSHEYRIIRPDGTVRWIRNRGFPVRDDQGRVTLFTGVATDITEAKALEAQLLQAQKMEAVGRLAGGVAHDFNNLLMAITGYGELMRAKVLKDDPLYGFLENILKAGDRAAALTQQLLTFSRRQIVLPPGGRSQPGGPGPGTDAAAAHRRRPPLGRRHRPGTGGREGGSRPDGPDHHEPGGECPGCHAPRRPAYPEDRAGGVEDRVIIPGSAKCRRELT